MHIPNRQKTLEVFLVFALAGLVFWFICGKKWPAADCRWLLILTTALVAIGLFVPYLAARFAALWLVFGELLGKVVSTFILGTVFFLLLTPIAWLYRRFTKNPLQLKRLSDSSRSYYIVREHDYQAPDLENLW